MSQTMRRCLLIVGGLMALGLAIASEARAQGSETGQSESVTWTCTGGYCPWGGQLGGEAVVWPENAFPQYSRFGYTASRGIYLPAASANGLTIAISQGLAAVYAGAPDAPSHRLLGILGPADQSLLVGGLVPGEVLSVQGNASFSFVITVPGASNPNPPVPALASKLVTATCAGSNCPAGASLQGHAAVWPSTASPASSWLSYSLSDAIFLPAVNATGATVTVQAGSAWVAAGALGSPSHRLVATLAAGQSVQLSGLLPGEFVTVQGSGPFSYYVEGIGGVEPPPVAGVLAELVTLTCGGGACPWGTSVAGYAAIWPSASYPVTSRLGYFASAGAYLPAINANGVSVSIVSGTAWLYAGLPGEISHRLLAQLSAGQSYTVAGLSAGEVLSVQSDETFRYSTTPPGTDNPVVSEPVVVQSIPAVWQCGGPDCSGADWSGHVISWPSWSAYQDNARSGNNSRVVYSADGMPLFPYMGSWAHGCQVTATSGQVLIVEWERGSDTWRETLIAGGQTHTISLQGSENGALIESNASFSVVLANCTQQPPP